MTPKEKALELFNKMRWEGVDSEDIAFHYFAMECAIVAIEEIINNDAAHHNVEYWKAVKIEVERII